MDKQYTENNREYMVKLLLLLRVCRKICEGNWCGLAQMYSIKTGVARRLMTLTSRYNYTHGVGIIVDAAKEK